MDLITKENILFEKWREKRPNFIPDGIVNPEIYAKQNIKVLYILKEVNGGENWDLRKFLQKADRWQTWNNIVRWQYAIENSGDQFSYKKIENVNKAMRQDILRHIAVINIKKEPGNASSNMEQIWSYSWDDRSLIREQIDLYNPTVIICCGTGKIVHGRKLAGIIKNWNTTKNNINYYQFDNRLIIDYVHPQSRKKGKEKLFNELFDAYNEIISSNAKTKNN